MCTIKLLGITWSLLRTLPNVPYITKYLHSGQRRHKLFPAFHELWKLFSYCFPIVLSLPWRRSCHHLRIKTQPKTEGSPLQTSRMHARLHATPLLQCTLNPPAPHGSLLSGPRPCDAWSSRTRPCVPISTSLGSAPVPPPSIAAMSSLMALHKLQRKSSSHLCPLSGITGCCHLSFGV